MKSLLWTLVILTIPLPLAWSICSLPGPVDPGPGSRPGPPPAPPGPDPVSPRDPGPDPATPDGAPPGKTETPPPATGPDDRRSPASAPDPSRPSGPGPETGAPRPPSAPTPAGRRISGRPGPAISFSGAWSLWWELNREHLLGLETNPRSRGEMTEGGEDPVTAWRERALPILRRIARTSTKNDVRAATLRALGRAGGDDEASLFLGLLRADRVPGEVLEGAAIGLGSLETVTDPRLRADLRRLFDDLLAERIRLPRRARLLGILAMCLRARDDPALARSLGIRCRKPVRSSSEAAALLLGMGLTRDELLVPELARCAAGGTLGGKKLQDVARSHATIGLVLTGRREALPVILGMLESGALGEHTRRSAILGLGVLLRKHVPDRKIRLKAERFLVRILDEPRDPLTRGFAAMGMGTAYEPFGIAELEKCVDKTGSAGVKPFAALALGMATRRLEPRDRDRDTAKLLVGKLREAPWGAVQTHIVVALCHLGGTAAIGPLLEILDDPSAKPTVRRSAATALGILLDPRERDPLFEIDACCNPYALTGASRELVRVY